ncbi:MAG: hypothetical protein WD042_05995 [Phycisphaeraceae bacterium]
MASVILVLTSAGTSLAQSPSEADLIRRLADIEQRKQQDQPKKGQLPIEIDGKADRPTQPKADVKPLTVPELKARISGHVLKKAGIKSVQPPPLPHPDGDGNIDFCPYAQEYLVVKKDKKQVYVLIAQHLTVVERLLHMHDIRYRRAGLGLAREVAAAAVDRVLDSRLASDITVAFILTNIAAGDKSEQEYLSQNALRNFATWVFAKSGDTDLLVETLRTMIADASNVNTADAERFRLAILLARLHRRTEAVAVLEQVTETTEQSGPQRLLQKLRREIALLSLHEPDPPVPQGDTPAHSTTEKGNTNGSGEDE